MDPPHPNTLLLFLLLTLLSCALPTAFAALLDNFPLEAALSDPQSSVPFARPVSAVYDKGTLLYVASSNGQILQVDVRTAVSRTLNEGGNDQPIGGLCLDSRDSTTLYATGRSSGKVYAFKANGQLVKTYQLAPPGTVFLTSCVQTQFQLLVVDSKNDHMYYLPLSDEKGIRGKPASTEMFSGEYVGFQLPLGGDWQQSPSAPINAYGIEWTQNYNRTRAFILNSATGILYSMPVSEKGVDSDQIKEVNVTGQIDTFPGAMGILFDSIDESVLYITMPHWNAIAVLEFGTDWDTEPKQAKFIRLIDNLSLANGPISISEYGNFIYVTSYRMRNPKFYTLIRAARYRAQRLEGQNYTTTYDDEPVPFKELTPIATVAADVLKAPPRSGRTAPSAVPDSTVMILPSVSPSAGPVEASPAPMESPFAAIGNDAQEQTSSGTGSNASKPPPTFSENNGPVTDDSGGDSGGGDGGGDGGGGSCFPSNARVTRRDGRRVRMDALRIGDEVVVGITGEGLQMFSKVYAFSHADSGAISEFVVLEVSNNQTLAVSPGHYVRVGRGTRSGLRTADDVEVGDVLTGGEGQSVTVRRTGRSRERGLYNPHTLHGDIMVDEILTSTFTSHIAVRCGEALLLPLRAMGRMNWTFGNRLMSWWLRQGDGGSWSAWTQGTFG